MIEHDPGGLRMFPMRPGTLGGAEFVGDNMEHRLYLMRDWAAGEIDAPYALSIGMNPSMANHLMDDLTVRKDQIFTEQFGLRRMFKGNVGSYRCTDPAGLTARGVVVSHPENLPMIRRLAADAALIFVATGRVPDVLVPHARTMFRALKQDGRRLMCLGLTRDGWPKHSSRLAYSTPFQEFYP